MPQNRVMGVALNIDVANALTGINNFKRNVKAAQSEFRQASSQMEDWGNKTEGVEAKLKELNYVASEHKKVLKVLEERLDKTNAEYAKNVKALEEAKASGTATKAQINELTKAVNKNRESIVKQTTDLNNQAAVTNKAVADLEKFEQQLQKLNDDKLYKIDELASEFELASATFEEAKYKIENVNDELNVQGLEVDKLSKKWSLSKAELSSLEQQLSDYEKEVEKSGVTTEQNTSVMNRLKTAIIKKRVEVAKDEAAVEKSQEAHKKLNNEVKFQNSNLGKLEKTLKKVGTALGDAEQGVQMLEGGFTVLKGVVANFISSSLHSLFGTLRYLLSSARELRKELGMIEAAGASIGLDTSELSHAEQTLKKIHGITEDTQGASEAINNLLTAGFKTDRLDKITDYLLGASIKWKDTLNMEGLSDSIQEAIGSKGMSVTGQFAELLERTGHNLKDWTLTFSSLGSDAERQDMIFKALAKGGLTDTLEQYKEINSTLIAENDIIFDTLHQSAKFAEFLNPMILKVKELGNELMLTFMKFFGYSEKTGEFSEEGKVRIQEIMNKLDALKDKIVSLFEWVLNNLPQLTAALGAVATSIFASKTASLGLGIMEKYKGAIVALGKEALTTKDKFGAMSTALTGGPFGLIAIAIAAVVAGLVALYHTNDEFKASVDELWAALKPALEDLMKTLIPILVDLVNNLVPVLVSLMESLMPIVLLLVDAIKKILPPILQIVETLLPLIDIILKVVTFLIQDIIARTQTFVDFLVAIFQTIKALFSGDTEKIGEIWKNFIDKIISTWSNLYSGLIKGLEEGWANLKKKFGELIDNFVNWFKEKFGIHSPSTLFAGFGKNIIQGLVNGIQSFYGKIKDTITSIVNFFTDLPSRIWNKIKGVADKIKEAFGSAVDKVKTIGKDIVSGLWEGIDSKTDWVKNKITGFAEKAGEAITDFFKINSPSKWAKDKGGNVGKSFGIGIADSADAVAKDISKFNNSVADGITGGLQNGMSNRSTVVNAGMTVNYNGTLSRKQLKQLENDNYKSIKTRLRMEGAI